MLSERVSKVLYNSSKQSDQRVETLLSDLPDLAFNAALEKVVKMYLLSQPVITSE